MTLRTKVAFWTKLVVLVFLFDIWGLLVFLVWYIKRIPQKRLPYAALFYSHQKRFYDWLSWLLKYWLMWSIIVFAVLRVVQLFLSGFMASYLLSIQGRDIGPLDIIQGLVTLLAALLFGPIWLGTLLGRVFVIVACIFGFWQAERVITVLFWRAEPAARALVGKYDTIDTHLPAGSSTSFEPGNGFDLSIGDYRGDKPYKDVIRHVVDAEIGINKATWLVQAGEAKMLHPAAGTLSRFGGPGIMIVQEGHAVVTERSGKMYQVRGRGIHPLEPFERPQMVFPLYLRPARVSVENALTKDGAAISKIDALVFHKMDPGSKNKDKDGRYPFDDEKIMLAWDPKGGDPAKSVEAIAASALRAVVAKHSADEIFKDLDAARDRLKDELVVETNKVTEKYIGIQAILVVIDDIAVPEAVSKTWEKWAAEQDRAILTTRGETEARVLAVLEKTKSKIRDDMIREFQEILATTGIVPSDLPGRCIALMERLTDSLIKEDIAILRQIEVVDRLVQSEAPKTIILGSGGPLLVPPSSGRT